MKIDIFKKQNKQRGSFFNLTPGKQKKVIEYAVREANKEQKAMVDTYLKTKTACR